MIAPATLAGRCSNGYERDQGRVVHAVPTNERGNDINHYARSLCNKTHGARSSGWSLRIDLTVNCPRCTKALARQYTYQETTP